MIPQQRSMYSQAVLDTISSLDNDASSITGQAENSLNDMKDSSKDDFVVREKLISLLKNYSYTRFELETLGGYSFKAEGNAELLFTESVNYGQYIYGRPSGYVEDVRLIYDHWFKKYGESDRGEKFKSDDIYGNDDVSAGEDGNDFLPEINPIKCLNKSDDNTGLVNKIDSYKDCYDIIGNGIIYGNNDRGVEIDSNEKYYSFSFSRVFTSKNNSYWTGEIKNGGIIFLLTADSNVMLIAEVENCKAEWKAIYGGGSCPGNYSPSASSYEYSFNLTFIPIEDIPYYYIQEPYEAHEIINGQTVTVTKYRNVKKYYTFYPLKNTSATSSIKLKYTQKIQKNLKEYLQELYDHSATEDGQIGYYNWVSMYSTSLNDRNYNIIWNNFQNLKKYLNVRLSVCEGVWKDAMIAQKVKELFDERMNKRGGTLKQWYEGAIMADDMEENYKKKLKRKKDVFETLLVQQPAEDFEGGNEMIIDDKCSDYYYKELGYYPSFNVGDVVYIMDEEKYETRCVISRKDRTQINDTAEVQYETVMRQDGKTEQVAKTDNNGEPITIYTYKNAWKITFNGNVPNMYDPSTVRLVKEL